MAKTGDNELAPDVAVAAVFDALRGESVDLKLPMEELGTAVNNFGDNAVVHIAAIAISHYAQHPDDFGDFRAAIPLEAEKELLARRHANGRVYLTKTKREADLQNVNERLLPHQEGATRYTALFIGVAVLEEAFKTEYLPNNKPDRAKLGELFDKTDDKDGKPKHPTITAIEQAIKTTSDTRTQSMLTSANRLVRFIVQRALQPAAEAAE